MGFFDRYHEMQEGGPKDTEETSNKIFKCKDCGAETFDPVKEWNGEPDTGACKAHCKSRASDWRPGRVSNAFRRNMAEVALSGETRFANKVKDVPPAVAAKQNWDANFERTFGVKDANRA